MRYQIFVKESKSHPSLSIFFRPNKPISPYYYPRTKTRHQPKSFWKLNFHLWTSGHLRRTSSLNFPPLALLSISLSLSPFDKNPNDPDDVHPPTPLVPVVNCTFVRSTHWYRPNETCLYASQDKEWNVPSLVASSSTHYRLAIVERWGRPITGAPSLSQGATATMTIQASQRGPHYYLDLGLKMGNFSFSFIEIQSR